MLGRSMHELTNRYENDPAFKAMVEQFYAFMCQAELTPYEVRDAALVAEYKFHQTHASPLMLDYDWGGYFRKESK